MSFANPDGTPAAPTNPPPPVKKEPEPEYVDEDTGSMNEEELAAHNKKEVVAKKNEGNDLYKKKEFSAALAKYDEAIELDPKNMCFLNNKATVYFTMKEWDTCIETCQRVVEVGKENFAYIEDRAKGLTRCGKAYLKTGDTPKATETLKESQLEHYQKETERRRGIWKRRRRTLSRTRTPSRRRRRSSGETTFSAAKRVRPGCR